MKTTPFLFLILLFAFCNTPERNGNASDNGKKDTAIVQNDTPISIYEANYTSEKGKYQCYFPDNYTPEEKVDVVKSPDGDLTLYSVSYETDVFHFSVRYCDYPKKVMKNFSQDEMLLNVITAFFANLDLKVTMQDSTNKFNGYPTLITMGQSNSPETNGLLYVYRKDFMVENRMYQLAVIRMDHYPDPVDYEKFIDTFKLIK